MGHDDRESGTAESSEFEFTDEELAQLALASADHNDLTPDAVAWNYRDAVPSFDLPEWYMPAAVGTRHSRGARLIVAALIFGFLLIDASGLCITSGFLTLA